MVNSAHTPNILVTTPATSVVAQLCADVPMLGLVFSIIVDSPNFSEIPSKSNGLHLKSWQTVRWSSRTHPQQGRLTMAPPPPHLTLDNFNIESEVPENCPFVLTSPRSLEACRRAGVQVSGSSNVTYIFPPFATVATDIHFL